MSAAGRWGRHRCNVVAEIGAANWLSLNGMVVFEVVERNETATLLHLGCYQIRDRPFVEAANASILDGKEGIPQIGLAQNLARLVREAIWMFEIDHGRGIVRKAFMAFR